jgi:site-specific DNA-methyltransferase (adenine-specific)
MLASGQPADLMGCMGIEPGQDAAVQLNRLVETDCIRGMESLPESCVDLAFADPPFNIGYEYDVYHDARPAEDYMGWTLRWGRALVRLLKPTGTFWLAIGDEYAAELKLLFQKELRLTCRSWVVWYYTFGVHCQKKFSRSHAHLFYFVKDAKAFTFNDEAIRVPSARQLVYADARAHPKGRMPDDTWILRPQDLPEGFGADEDTWYFPRVCGTFKERAGWHGCQMPEQLLGRIIRACSNQDDVVLDPFAGSGTTLVTAKKLGRRWLGFELSAEYARQTQARLDAAHVRQALEGAESPLTSVPTTAQGKRREEESQQKAPSPRPKRSKKPPPPLELFE